MVYTIGAMTLHGIRYDRPCYRESVSPSCEVIDVVVSFTCRDARVTSTLSDPAGIVPVGGFHLSLLLLVAGRSGKPRLECTSCGAGNVHSLVAPDPSIRPSQHRRRAHHITTGLPRQDESPLGCINHRSSYAGIHCPAPSWIHAPSAYLCEGMASINHGPWRPCVRAR